MGDSSSEQRSLRTWKKGQFCIRLSVIGGSRAECLVQEYRTESYDRVIQPWNFSRSSGGSGFDEAGASHFEGMGT